LLIALLVLGGVHLANAAPALACDCAGTTDEEAFENADAVFVGELTRYRPPVNPRTSMDPAVYRFTVEGVYKGDVVADQAVGSAGDGASCGLEIREPGRYLVFASTETFDPETRAEGVDLYANLCGGTRPAAEAPIPASFGETKVPAPGATHVTGPSAVDVAAHAGRSVLSVVFEFVWLIKQAVARAFAALG
jgi:hypothetical protein